MSIEKRIEKLEERTGIGQEEDVKLIVVTGGLNREAADAKIEATKAEYLAAHPECARKDIKIFIVPNEDTKEAIEWLLAGGRRGEQISGESAYDDT